MIPLSKTAHLAYRDQLRESRDLAVADAEGFQEVLFAVERLGTAVLKKVTALGQYKHSLIEIAELSPLAFKIPKQHRNLFTPFDLLYDILRVARNDALHQGAYARHLTTHAIELSLVLEDALTVDSISVADFMVKGVICAELWQPLAYLRQIMLANSFSFLPVKLHDDTWALISDRSLAQAFRREGTKREVTLGMTLDDAIQGQIIKPDAVTLVSPETEVDKILIVMDLRPVLVCRSGSNEVIGIVTSFDLM